MGGSLFGMNNTVANVVNDLTNYNSNMSISDTKLESVAEVYQNILNEANTELTTKQKVNSTNEQNTNMNVKIGKMSNKGNNNKNIIKQESIAKNSTTLSLIANTFASSEFDIQQKFLLARALELINDNNNAYVSNQGNERTSSSSTGTSADLACQSQAIFGFNNCASNVQNYLTNISKNEVKSILQKTNKELTSISQNNVVKVINYISSVINNVNINNVNIGLEIDEMSNEGKENVNEIHQKSQLITELVNEIVSTVNNNAIHSSSNDTTNTSTEKTSNSNDSQSTMSQTNTSKTEVSNIVAIVVAVVIAIIIIIAIPLVYKYYKNKKNGYNNLNHHTNELINHDSDIEPKDNINDKNKQIVNNINQRNVKNGYQNKSFNSTFKDRRLYNEIKKHENDIK